MKLRLFVVVGMAVAMAATSCSSESNEPADAINGYVAAYNSGDIDAVMVLFTDESSISGHPMGRSASGLTHIRSLQTRDMDAAAATDAYSISNVQVTGDTVTWDHAWVSDGGDVFCVEGQTAVVQDGRILTWRWPVGRFDCP